MTGDPIQTRIEAAVGQTCSWWSSIEHLVHDLCLHLATCISLDFDRDATRAPLHMALSNMDLRQRIATAKAMASQAPTASATFYDRLASVLNRIDTELRAERNRFVHDLWILDSDDEMIQRFRQRTMITRPQSRQRELLIGTSKSYGSVEEVESFVLLLEAAFRDLCEFDGETAHMVSELERLELSNRSTQHSGPLTTNS